MAGQLPRTADHEPSVAASNALSLSKGPSPSWFVYVVRCSDGSYYVGHAQNVAYRVNVHNAGDGASWTRRRRPVVLVYQEPVADESSAVQRELQLKGWSRAKKEALIAGDFERLKELSSRKFIL